jgi:acyl-CoA synthetase (AMP-forming)/AMP-acid ligase II
LAGDSLAECPDAGAPTLASRLAAIADGLECGRGLALLRGFPVAACALNGRYTPDGQIPQASVVLREPTASAALIAWLRSRLSDYKIPRIEFVNALPLGPGWKIRRGHRAPPADPPSAPAPHR